MNSADWAMMPGARNARHDTGPVLITCSLLNVVPKISSHSAGCTIRVTSSVRSRRSFCISTIANALTRLNVAGRRCHPRGARVSVTGVGLIAVSTGTAGNLSAGTDFTERPGTIGLLRQVRRGVMPENVFERGTRRNRRLQLRRRPHGAKRAVMHQRNPVAQGVGLFHVMRGQQHGHAELTLHVQHMGPDAVA